MVENKVWQGGMIAAKSVINSPPDGYTIMFVAPNNAIGQTLYKNLPFVFLRDTTPIAGIMQLANIMVVPPSLPVKTVAEFIAYAKANPGKLTLRRPATARRFTCRRAVQDDDRSRHGPRALSRLVGRLSRSA